MGHRGARVAGLTAALVVCLASALHGNRSAHAEPETVALLPLDAEARLEVYGQPVASEIAKALREGSIDVVVVGAKKTTPPTTKLIVDGSLSSSTKAAGGVLLQLRVRNAVDGTTLETFEEPASSLAMLTTAANKIAGRLLPWLRVTLEALRKPEGPDVNKPKAGKPAPAPDPVMLVGIGISDKASLMMEPLRSAMASAVGDWLRTSKRRPSAVDASVLGKQLATQTVASARAERGLVFEILDYTIEEEIAEDRRPIPLARARVRVRIADAQKIVFDHVIATDTIVGDRQMRGEQLAARVAREVLTILRPHMRRVEPTWR